MQIELTEQQAQAVFSVVQKHALSIQQELKTLADALVVIQAAAKKPVEAANG
jgi:hypothetical protein